MKRIKDILIIASMKSVPDLKRQPLILLLLGLVSSLPLFFIMVYGADINQGLVGAMTSTISFIGLTAAIQDVAYDRFLKMREMMVAMPVHPLSYALGVGLAPLIVATPGLIFFGAISLWIGALTLPSLFWTSAVLVLCWATMSSIGFLISTYLQKAPPYVLGNIANVLGLLLSFIPPVYYPEEVLGAFSWTSTIFPTSNAVSLIRVYSGSLTLPFETIVVRWAILIIAAAFFAALTVVKARWREP